MTAALLESLRSIDNQLAAAPAGDFGSLESLLAQRARLLEQLTPLLGAQHLHDLEASHVAGLKAMRNLILTRHMIATEIAQLSQERHLAMSIAPEPSRSATHLD